MRRAAPPVRFLPVLGLLLWCLFAWPASAAPGEDGPVFVTPPEAPTEVGVGLMMLGLVEVSDPSEPFTTFTAEVLMDVEWDDPRLAFTPTEGDGGRHVYLEHEAELELEQIWWPDITFGNAQGERHVENRELVIEPGGHVRYAERFRGIFSSPMDLVKFPFDHQELEIHLESFAWDERHVRFVPLDKYSGVADRLETLEWLVDGADIHAGSRTEVRSPEQFSEVTLTVEVSRKPGYYIYKIVLPMLIIVAFNWTTFWMPGEEASVRMERAVIALLTVVAFHQVVASNLPRIGYLTFMDGVVFVAFGSVGLTMLASIWAQSQQAAGKPERIEQLDRIGRWAYPLIFTLAVAILWVVYH